MSDWTSSVGIRQYIQGEWERGRLLVASFTHEPLYPWRIALKSPNSAALTTQFDAARQWIRLLSEGAKTETSAGYRLEFQDINHRQWGRNRLPIAAWLDSEADALALIGKRREAARFHQLANLISAAFPSLRDWIIKRPLRVLEQGEDWPALLAVLRWIVTHPRSNVYLRQIDLPGVHSKFIERQRGLLSELLAYVLSADAIDCTAPSGIKGFEQRYGFRAKPLRVRFRLLEGALHGLTDLSVPADEFARLSLPAQRVFMTENEINFLAFPCVPNSVLLFGAGYGFESLLAAQWLQTREIFYWGDIDTHGFAILDQLRSHFPHVHSLLMDQATLLAHRPLWGREDTPTQRNLTRLHPDEASLYDDLCANRLAPALRLEQERIGFDWVGQALYRSTFF
jgi:hypothetical protein